MSRYASLRSARLAKRVSGADRAYFHDVVSPLLKAKYAELQAAGQAPFYRTYEQALEEILKHKRESGNIVFGDAEAFIYPPLNEAHKQGGENALYSSFSDVLAAHNERMNGYLQRYPEEVKIVIAAGEKIDRLNNSALLRTVDKLSTIFKRSKEKSLVSRQAQIAYNTLLGIAPHSKLPIGMRPYDLRASYDVSPESLVAFYRHRDKLLADMPPKDYGPLTLTAPALPEQKTELTAPRLPPQKPVV